MNVKQYTPNEFAVITPSSVDFVGYGKEYTAVLDDEVELKLDPRGQMSAALQLGMDHSELKDEFLDGRFFIVDGEVVDHRFKSNRKFEHSTDSVNQLMDKLGMVQRVRHDWFGNERLSRPMLMNTRDAFEVNPLNSIGGEMDIHIGFNWSPFELDIHSVIEMWRQICTNGAIACSPILDNRIPMLSRWEESLKISDHVVRHNFDKLVLPRLAAMPTERITQADVLVLQRILGDLHESKHLSGSSIMALNKMQDVVGQAWVPGADDLRSNTLKFIEAPMTAYDAYNIVTEAATHHLGRDRTNHKAQAFVSSLIFNEDRRRASRTELDTLLCDTNTFANPDKAFFGETCH